MWKAINSSIGRKFIMAISGLLLGLFIIAHALGNTTALFGGKLYNSYAHHLHSLGVFLIIMEVGLGLIFVVHIIYGILLFLENNRARGISYKSGRQDLLSWPARSMPYTGLLILIFIGVHYFQLHSGNPATETAIRVKAILSALPSGLFYILTIMALTFHAGHGFWSTFQSLGISHPRYDGMIRKSTLITAMLAGLLLILLPVLALLSDTFLR